MPLLHPLIHDWNAESGGSRPFVMLNDETLRDGLQSPSVRTPAVEEKLDLLARMDVLGIDTADIGQRTGVPIECCAFIGSSPIRQYAEGWTIDFLQRTTADAIGFAVKQGLTVMYVTEDTTRADPASLRALFTTALRA